MNPSHWYSTWEYIPDPPDPPEIIAEDIIIVDALLISITVTVDGDVFHEIMTYGPELYYPDTVIF